MIPSAQGEVFVDPLFLAHELESIEYQTHNVPWRKQHEIWRHGNTLIAGANSQRDFEVAIMQLQRAVEQRDTILERLYRFKDVPWVPKSLNQYSNMAALGIIRPSLKKPLRELRNKIAHGVDDIPLSREQCNYLADTAWYYLKATDLIARQCASTLVISFGEDDPHWTTLEFGFTPGFWAITIKGTVPDGHLLLNRAPNALSVRLESSQFEMYRGVRRLKFAGLVAGSDDICQKILQTFFEEAL